jgi:hypothetical protein
MAVQYFGVNRGAQSTTVTTGTSSTSKNVEVAVDLTKSMTRAEVIQALDEIRIYILSNPSPFAQ